MILPRNRVAGLLLCASLCAAGAGCEKKDERSAKSDLEKRSGKLVEDMDKYAEPVPSPSPTEPVKAPETPKPTTIAPPPLSPAPAPADPVAPTKKVPEKP